MRHLPTNFEENRQSRLGGVFYKKKGHTHKHNYKQTHALTTHTHGHHLTPPSDTKFRLTFGYPTLRVQILRKVHSHVRHNFFLNDCQGNLLFCFAKDICLGYFSVLEMGYATPWIALLFNKAFWSTMLCIRTSFSISSDNKLLIEATASIEEIALPDWYLPCKYSCLVNRSHSFDCRDCFARSGQILYVTDTTACMIVLHLVKFFIKLQVAVALCRWDGFLYLEGFVNAALAEIYTHPKIWRHIAVPKSSKSVHVILGIRETAECWPSLLMDQISLACMNENWLLLIVYIWL